MVTRTARSKLGGRLIEVEVITNEKTTVVIDLTRGRKTLASHISRAVRPGDKVLTLIVPESVAKGTAVVHTAVETATGGRKLFHATVRIPRT